MTAAIPIDVTEESRSRVSEWFHASQENDDAWFYENAQEEFVYQMGDGGIEGLDVIVPFSHRITNKEYAVQELTAHRYGSVILAYGVYSARGELPADAVPKEYAAKYARGVNVRFVQVWVNGDDGMPRIALLQSTVLTDDEETPAG